MKATAKNDDETNDVYFHVRKTMLLPKANDLV